LAAAASNSERMGPSSFPSKFFLPRYLIWKMPSGALD
jgi:hypothetical protein